MPLTLDYLQTLIRAEHYTHAVKTTVCFLTLTSGFEVIGTASVADPAQFSRELG